MLPLNVQYPTMKRKSPLRSLFSLGINLGLFGAILLALLLGILSLSLPKISGITEFTPPIPSQILSRDRHLLLEVGVEKRDLTPIANIPQKVIDAFLVAEDKNFYSHHGVDYFGILRAAWANLKAGRVVQGGSTITQQVAKQLYLSGRRSMIRKIRDMLLALKLEKKFSKDEILYLYLNQVYLGGGYYGVTAAFRGYFEKELSEATIAECALIAGLLVAPGRYSPYVNPEYAKMRQNYVLNRLFDTKKIIEEEYQNAKKEIIRFSIKKTPTFKAGYFTHWIKEQIESKVGKNNFGGNGFKVVTTIDSQLQEKAEKYIKEGLKSIDKRQGYSGSLITLQSEERIYEFQIKQREKIYKSNSKYFHFNPQSEELTKYEIGSSEEDFERIRKYDKEVKEQRITKSIYPGNSKKTKDPFKKFIKDGDSYEAVVLKTNNQHQIIYASIGGVKGIIPHKGYQWARKRLISEKRNYVPLVTYPSHILKRGDIILVKILNKEKSIYELINSSSKISIQQNNEIASQYQSQYFLELELDQESEVEGALIAIHPISGEILSLVGGKDFKKSQFNRAIQALRQPGSSFKPILYAAALENGYKPNDVLIDSPETLGGVSQTLSWKPRNYDGTFKGPMTVRNALEISRNVPTIKIASKIGIPKLLNFIKRIGLRGSFNNDLSLALGSAGVTLMNLTKTYAIFPNGGNLIVPKTILSITDRFGTEYELENFEYYEQKNIGEDNYGPEVNKISEKEHKKELQENTAKESDEKIKKTREKGEEEEQEEKNIFLSNLSGKYIYDKRLSYIMTNLLQGVIQNGTGRSARSISSFIGGKTGTTNRYVDALFLGFSSNIALGVWTGFDNNNTLGWGETGAKTALPIWKNYMQAYLRKYGEYDFKRPDGIINVQIDKETGELADRVDESSRKTIMETFVFGTEPGADGIVKKEGITNEQGEGNLLDDGSYFRNQ